MESTTGQSQKAPLIFRQNSATQPGATSQISSAKQPPPSRPPATPSAAVEPTTPMQPSASSALFSSAQFPPTKHISTATQPPSPTTSSNIATHSIPGSDAAPPDTEDAAAPMRDFKMQTENPKPSRVSEIMFALAQSTLANQKTNLHASFKKEAKVEESASDQPAMGDKPATPKNPAPSDKVEVSLLNGRLTFTEGSNEGSSVASSQVPISQLIAVMEKSATPASNGSVVAHITSAADPPSNRATFRRNENAETLEFIPGKTEPTLPLLASKMGSYRSKISPPPPPSISHQLISLDNQQSPTNEILQPPPIPARKVSLSPPDEQSSSRGPAALQATQSQSPVGNRPLPPTPPVSESKPPYTNRPPAPLPTNRDNITNLATMKTATLPPLNTRTQLPVQLKTNSLPPGIRIPATKDVFTAVKQNTHEMGDGEYYDTLVYEQVDGDVQSRILKIEETQLNLRRVLQTEQNQVLDEVKRLSASVEHLKTWTLRCQEMLISDTTKSQESVESLKARSNEVTRLLREHIILISQDVSKASAHIFQPDSAKEHVDNRVMHVFDWNLQLLGGSETTVTSQAYHIKEVNISLTGAAHFTRDGNIYLKVIGDSAGKMKPDSELTGNFTCKACITDASDTMPDWSVGKVMGNLFKDSEWVVGTVSVSEVKDKSYCAEGKTFKVKYAVDLYK